VAPDPSLFSYMCWADWEFEHIILATNFCLDWRWCACWQAIRKKYEEKKFPVASLKSMKQEVGSGVGLTDQDLHQDVRDPQYWSNQSFVFIIFFLLHNH
jgi:hypothetical protein